MRAILLAFSLILSINTVSASEFFENLIGCYKTVKWNGNLVDQTNFANYGEIKKSDALLTLDMNGNPMLAYEMILVQQVTDDTIEFGLAFPFINHGTYSENNGTHKFTYQGQVRYRIQPDLIGNMEHIVEASKLNNGHISIKNYIRVQETSEFDVDETYELKPTACF